MKWIFRQPALKKFLGRWTRGNELLFCHFFFYEQGEIIQKSREGLLRSILLQLLEAKPELAKVAFPQLFVGLPPPPVPLDWVSLKSALNKAVSHAGSKGWRLCMLIDGLDEYRKGELVDNCTQDDQDTISDDGDEGDAAWGDRPVLVRNHQDIVDLFLGWKGNPNLKLCVSSRELPVFENGFSGCPRLKLHELTRADMERYVSDKIGQDFLGPADREAIVSDIVKKSCGVFLWVSLVVDAISHHTTMGDFDKAKVRAWIDALPSELGGKQGLYAKMLQLVEPKSMAESFRLVQLVQASPYALDSSLASHALTFYEGGGPDIDRVLVAKIRVDEPPEEGNHAQERFRMKLKHLSGGLLECEAPLYRVKFIHLTAKEFLLRESTRERFYKDQLLDQDLTPTSPSWRVMFSRSKNERRFRFPSHRATDTGFGGSLGNNHTPSSGENAATLFMERSATPKRSTQAAGANTDTHTSNSSMSWIERWWQSPNWHRHAVMLRRILTGHTTCEGHVDYFSSRANS